MEQEAQDRLAPELEKLSKLLVAIEEAMRAFGQTGWVNKKIQRAKAAKKFSSRRFYIRAPGLPTAACVCRGCGLGLHQHTGKNQVQRVQDAAL